MKKFFAIVMMAFALMACGSKTTENATTEVEMVATEIVPAAATEVIPCAAPGPDAGGQVATEVIPDTVK